ncbi:hypothetical protein B0T19DRAFT_166692 [Cercophora scortea]|uniref:Uncharacterized protein n=1 Tax=Cercophora scortea TaxID=314031 RepID=A0AAE0MCM6_9PEZI|nr:hypothetical protein B0T19DRAFT_166692 [Cercophora scortea]
MLEASSLLRLAGLPLFTPCLSVYTNALLLVFVRHLALSQGCRGSDSRVALRPSIYTDCLANRPVAYRRRTRCHLRKAAACLPEFIVLVLALVVDLP